MLSRFGSDCSSGMESNLQPLPTSLFATAAFPSQSIEAREKTASCLGVRETGTWICECGSRRKNA